MITLARHPYYRYDDYFKYRITYEGGRVFIQTYLEKYDKRETQEDFDRRLRMTYCPGFAAEGINEIANAIFQRLPEVIRTDVIESYSEASCGENGGVDLLFSTVSKFMGKKVLPELLALGRVGVYVDMPKFREDATLAEFNQKPRPYLYIYQAEDILNWSVYNTGNELILTKLMLRENYILDGEFGIPTTLNQRFRYLKLVEGGVELKIIIHVTDPKTREVSEQITDTFFLKLPRIPFVVGDIGQSLLKNISDYQVALLNLASSDIKYVLDCNFPIYTEQYDPKTGSSPYVKQAVMDDDGTLMPVNPSPKEVPIGVSTGRQYPIGAERPGFVTPSTEPLKASMMKQDEMKQDIRRLLNLAVSNVDTGRASAESKKVDQGGLESGMASIALELESIERQVVAIWAAYENAEDESYISYPSKFDLKTNQDRVDEAKGYNELKGVAPSRTFGKELSKLAARTLLEGKVDDEIIVNIIAEIDAAKYTTGDYKEIASDIDKGLVTVATASDARGYDGSYETPLAKAEHAARLAEITKAQTSGNPDIGNKTTPPDLNPTDPTKRGQGK